MRQFTWSLVELVVGIGVLSSIFLALAGVGKVIASIILLVWEGRDYDA